MFLFILKYIFFFNSLFKQGLDWILMGILSMPSYDRPGERLKKYGAGSLSDSELLEILIGNTLKGSVVSLSQKLLKKYNLNKLNELSFNELTKECNGDFVAASRIMSFIELSKRRSKLVNGGYNKRPITCAKDVYNMLKDHVKELKKERLYCVLLDTKNIPFKVVRVSEGTLNSSLIHPREVFKEAIKESAFSVMLVHNHPSGNPEPSGEDLDVTRKIIETGKMLDILVLDHVIIGKDKFWNWLDTQS